MSVPSVGMGAMVGAPWIPAMLEGSRCLLGEAEVHQGGWAGEVEIAPDRAHGSGALMTSWGLGEAEAIALSLEQFGS
jgi:hypothetical protein